MFNTEECNNSLLTSSSWSHDGLHSRECQTQDASYKDIVSEVSMAGGFSEIPPKVLLMHTAQAIPCSRWMVGNTSAEYWNATGPSPKE